MSVCVCVCLCVCVHVPNTGASKIVCVSLLTGGRQMSVGMTSRLQGVSNELWEV